MQTQGINRAAVDSAAVDKAFQALASYDWGTDREILHPIDAAVAATHGDAAARGELEKRLVAVLDSDASRSAKDFVCRTLKTMGTATCVPSLAARLADNELSHMARYALERIQASEAAAALRDGLARVSGALKIGVIGSLGVRRDAASVASLTNLVADADRQVASAAAWALGTIGTPEAGKALSECQKKAPEEVKPAITDACLACADQLLADGHKSAAVPLYQSLSRATQPHVRLAATRGLLAATGK